MLRIEQRFILWSLGCQCHQCRLCLFVSPLLILIKFKCNGNDQKRLERVERVVRCLCQETSKTQRVPPIDGQGAHAPFRTQPTQRVCALKEFVGAEVSQGSHSFDVLEWRLPISSPISGKCRVKRTVFVMCEVVCSLCRLTTHGISNR